MKLVVEKKTLKRLIEKILREASDEEVSYPASAEYRTISSALNEKGIEYVPFMAAIAAIFLKSGDDDQFLRSLLSSKIELYSGWQTKVLAPYLAAKGLDSEISEERSPEIFGEKKISGGALSDEKVERLVSSLSLFGKSDLAQRLRSMAADWNKKAFRYPKITAEMVNQSLSIFGVHDPKNRSDQLGRETTGKDASGKIEDQNLPGLFPRNELLGKKFSSKNDGQPDFVVIYVGGEDGPDKNLFIAIRYSTSRISVIPEYGRELNIEEIKSIDASKFYDVFVSQKSEAFNTIKHIQSMSDEDIEQFKGVLFSRYTIFVPKMNKFQRPVFAATEAAQEAARNGKCTISMRTEPEVFMAQLGSYLYDPASMTDEEKLQIMICLKDNTVDSLGYALAQALLSATGIGIGVEVLSDLIPGLILAHFYSKQGNQNEANRIIAMTLIAAFVPFGLDKFFRAVRGPVEAAVAAGKVLSPAEVAAKILSNPAVELGVSFPAVMKLFSATDDYFEKLDMRSPGKKYMEEQLAKLSSVDDIPKFVEENINNEKYRKAYDEQGILAKYPDI